jgi:hypothetical protein
MSMTCRLCEQPLLEPSFAAGICADCARTIKMTPMPPPRRRAAPCARCNGMRFVRAIPREYSGEYDSLHPMTVTQEPRVEGKLFARTKNVYRPSPDLGFGALEMYACLGCGFVEWYCQDPENIPIGPEHMTDVVDYTPDKPYR